MRQFRSVDPLKTQSLLWLGLAICKMLHYIVFMPLLAPMFAGLVTPSISMLSGENFQSLCVSEKGVVSFGLV